MCNVKDVSCSIAVVTVECVEICLSRCALSACTAHAQLHIATHLTKSFICMFVDVYVDISYQKMSSFKKKMYVGI